MRESQKIMVWNPDSELDMRCKRKKKILYDSCTCDGGLNISIAVSHKHKKRLKCGEFDRNKHRKLEDIKSQANDTDVGTPTFSTERRFGLPFYLWQKSWNVASILKGWSIKQSISVYHHAVRNHVDWNPSLHHYTVAIIIIGFAWWKYIRSSIVFPSIRQHSSIKWLFETEDNKIILCYRIYISLQLITAKLLSTEQYG